MTSFTMIQGKMVPAEEWDRPGKPQWRDHLVVDMSRHDALRCIEQLSGQLQRSDHERVLYTVVGELDETEEG